MELMSLKKIFWAFIIFCGAVWYINDHYTFRDVLQYSKRHADSSYAPMLDYYAATGLYIRSDFDGAIEGFNQLLTDYPTCQYAPDALYKLSDSYMERNRWAEAREALERFIEQFPNDAKRQQVDQKYEYVKFK